MGRVISWLDRRGEPFDAAWTAQQGKDFFARHVGHGASAVAIGQLLRLRRQTPDRLDSPRRIGFVGDVIVGRLCGRRVHDATSLAIAMLYNPWLRRADPEILAHLGLSEEQLPSLSYATTAAGTLTAQAAEALGIPAGIPVSPAVHDQYTASLGAGSVEEGDINFGAGTAWVLLANTGLLTPPVVDEAYVCQHPLEGLFGQLLSLRNGGSAIQWILSLLGRQTAGYEAIDAALGSTPPGADGLRFWPFVSNCPEPALSGPPGGRVAGISLAHRPEHFVRAVIEGLACEVLRHLRLLTSAGLPAGRLVMCGSTAAGRHTPQIIADVTRLPIRCIEAADTSALGAAMIARSLVDATDLATIGRQWAPTHRTVDPAEGIAGYDDLLDDYFSLLLSSMSEATV